MAIASNNPLTRAVTLTPSDSDGVAYEAGVIFSVACTVAGNVSVDMAAGGTVIMRIEEGQNFLPMSVSRVNVTGTTATATYTNLF